MAFFGNDKSCFLPVKRSSCAAATMQPFSTNAAALRVRRLRCRGRASDALEQRIDERCDRRGGQQQQSTEHHHHDDDGHIQNFFRTHIKCQGPPEPRLLVLLIAKKLWKRSESSVNRTPTFLFRTFGARAIVSPAESALVGCNPELADLVARQAALHRQFALANRTRCCA